MPRKAHHDPRTKAALLDALISPTYDGNIRSLGSGARVERPADNLLRLVFPTSGVVYDLEVHRPRQETAEAS